MKMAWQVVELRGKAFLDKFKQYNLSTVCEYAKRPIGEDQSVDKGTNNRSCLVKLTERDSSLPTRNFESKKIHIQETAISCRFGSCREQNCSQSTEQKWYHYCRSHKKSLLRPEDLAKRLRYYKGLRKENRDQSWWNYTIRFYLDGKGFVYKRNPLNQATASRSREWRKPSEGFMLGCTTNRAKEVTKKANFMVVIFYKRVVILCEQHFAAISEDKFSKLVNRTFEQV